MASTPESKVKNSVHRALSDAGAYAVNYIGGMYANNGTPDILACLHGRFIGIEAKAGKNKPTAIQMRNLRDIDDCGGLALVINEENLCYLRECLHDIKVAKSNYHLFEVKRRVAVEDGDDDPPRKAARQRA